jgi:hypothetical protein
MPASPQGDQEMSMLNGVSECWWLSSRCVVNWDAWAAIGTVAAVFAAIFAPSIQRRIQRKRANAIFAAAYVNDQLSAITRFSSLCAAHPISKKFEGWTAARVKLRDSKEARDDFSKKALAITEAFKSGLDGSKWPAVDQQLVLAVAHCVESVSDLGGAAEAIHAEIDVPWNEFMDAMENLFEIAGSDFQYCGEMLDKAKARSPRR